MKRAVVPIFLAAVIALVAMLVGLSVGSTEAGLGDLYRWIAGGGTEGGAEAILLNVRLPRVLTAFLAGALLACAGGAFQGIFRNPLADPYVTGCSTSAALGAIVALFLGIRRPEPIALLFGIGSAWLVLRIAAVRGRVPVLNLLLAGFAVGAFASALLSLVIYASARDAGQIVAWLMGNISGASWNTVVVLLPTLVVALLFMTAHAKELNILSLGEEQARTMGVFAERVKIRLLMAGSCAVALTVCYCGAIGFVGLIVPHVVRMVTGPDHRLLLPLSALIGGALLTLADALSRTIVAPMEIPVGIVTSLLGLPFFLYLLRTRAGR